MKKLFLLFILLLSYASTPLHAQEKADPSQNFYVQGRIIDETPFIKIIPGNQAAWFFGMKKGYKISISSEIGSEFSEYTVITENLHPDSEAAFKDSKLPANYADAMRKMIYEENYAAPGKSFDDMLLANENMTRLYYSYMLFSSYNPQLSVMSGLQVPLANELSARFKIKVEINEHPEYNYEQIMLKKHFYTDTQSPIFNLVQGDKEISIEWTHSDYKMLFIAYTIERSEDGKNFNQNTSPLLFNSLSDAGSLGMISFTDSLPENYKSFWYRVRGYDAFGFLSKAGDAKSIQGKDLTAPEAPKRVNVDQITNELISITWEQEAVPDLQGFQVIAATSETGQYMLLHESLLSPSTSTFSYDLSNGFYRYYRVLAVDTAHNASHSDLAYLVVYDTIPPAIPNNISVLVDSNMRVTIKWDPSKDLDIEGYRVYKSYHPSHSFVSISPMVIRDTLFNDTIPSKRLDKKVYYQVSALDKHYNHSKPSAYVVGSIPDFNPPTKPLLMKADLNSSGHVILEWNPSSSADVASYSIIRKIENDTVYESIQTLPIEKNESIDISFDEEELSAAEYYVVAIDSSGNVSDYSNGKRVVKMKGKSNELIRNIVAITNEGRVELTWNYQSDDSYSVLVYRSESDENYELIDRVNQKSGYVDRNVKSGKKYYYKLGLLESSGKRYPLSEKATVKLK